MIRLLLWLTILWYGYDDTLASLLTIPQIGEVPILLWLIALVATWIAVE